MSDSSQPPVPTTLYRFFAEDGDLLYVGVTNNAGNRFDQHRISKPWWDQVATITVTHYEDRETALYWERSAIRHEMPAYNIRELEHLKCWARPHPGTIKRFPDPCARCMEADKYYFDRGGWERYAYRVHLRGLMATFYYRCEKCGHEWTCGHAWQSDVA